MTCITAFLDSEIEPPTLKPDSYSSGAQMPGEVMQKLEDQQVLLRRAMPGPPSAPVLFDSLAVAGSASSPSMTSSVMQEIIDNSSRSQEAAEGGTRKGDYHSEYGKVCTYTSFDMQLREGADSFSGTVSRKQFADIISTKHVQSEQPAERWTVTRLANHPYFDMFFGMVVLSNAVFIGADLQMRLSHNGVQPLSMRIVQYFYAFLFTCELILRVIAQGKRFLFSEDWMWSVLDIFIVMTSLWEVLAGILQDIADSEVGSIGGVSSLKAFRIIRLTRILKTVRVIRLFRFVLALRTLITSIFSTLKSLFWALMLLTLIVYVFAILFAQAINDHLSTPDAAPLDEVATERYFGDLTNTMLSLFMSIVGGVSWEEVIAPLKVISPIWVVLFLFYISFTYLAVPLDLLPFSSLCSGSVSCWTAGNAGGCFCCRVLCPEIHTEAECGDGSFLSISHCPLVDYSRFPFSVLSFCKGSLKTLVALD